MWVSRSLIGPGALRASVLSLCLAAGSAAFAQDTAKSAPSPAAPGDMSKPMFDTTTPVYDSITSLDKAASTVVAEVEGRPITMGNVGDAIRAMPPATARLPFDALYPIVLEQLIQQQALVIRAQQQGLDEEPAIRRRVRAAADRELAEQYMQTTLSKGITEAKLLDRYNRDVAGKPGPDEVHTRIILTDNEKAALSAIAELKGGADFATVAQRASKDSTAAAGGDLGFKTREELNPEVGAVAFALPVGQVTPSPVHGAAGWFVVKVEERRQRATPSFASVREELRQTMLTEGVVPLAAAALKDLKVRRYNFTGTEASPEKPAAQ
jgi:peptidyl-prolyl cis-trans isomerase C